MDPDPGTDISLFYIVNNRYIVLVYKFPFVYYPDRMLSATHMLPFPVKKVLHNSIPCILPVIHRFYYCTSLVGRGQHNASLFYMLESLSVHKSSADTLSAFLLTEPEPLLSSHLLHDNKQYLPAVQSELFVQQLGHPYKHTGKNNPYSFRVRVFFLYTAWKQGCLVVQTSFENE